MAERADDVLAKSLAGRGLPPEIAGELAGASNPLRPVPPIGEIEDAARRFGVETESLASAVHEARLIAALSAAGDPAYPATVASLAGEPDVILALQRLEPLVRNSEPAAALAAARVLCERFPDAVGQLLRALRQLRQQQSTGALEPRPHGLGLVGVLATEGAGAPPSGPWVSVKWFGDNTWKQPRPNPPLALLVIDANDEFDPTSTSLGPTGPTEAQRFVRSPTGPSVVLVTIPDGTGLAFKHLYALGSDPLARAILEGAPTVWPRAGPEQFQEVAPDLAAEPLHGSGGGTAWPPPPRTQVTRQHPTIDSLAEVLQAFREHLDERSVRYDASTTVDLLASFLSCQFLLFAGPSGTGKSTAAKALQAFFAPHDSRGIIEARRQLIGPEDVAGHLSPIVGRYVRVRDLDELLRLHDSGPEGATPVLLVEEINLSPVEGYLSPLVHGLSGLASEAVEWRLHHDGSYMEVPDTVFLRPFPRLLGTINVDSTAMAPAPKVTARACVILLEPPDRLDVAGGLDRLRAGIPTGADAYAGRGAHLVGDPHDAVRSSELDDGELTRQLTAMVDLTHGAGAAPAPPAGVTATPPPNLVTRRQLDQCLLYASWFALLAKAFETTGGSVAGDVYRMASENALLHFMLPSLAPVEFGLALGRLIHAGGDLTAAANDTELGGVLRSRVSRLASAGGLSMGGRTLDFWDRLS